MRPSRTLLSIVIVLAFLPLSVGKAQGLASQIGHETGVLVHLQDGQEFKMPLPNLIAFGKSLFVARFTTDDGLGRPLTIGTGAPLSDPSSPLVFPRNSNRIRSRIAKLRRVP